MAYIFSSLALLISVISFFVLRSEIKKRTAIDRIPSDVRNDVDEIVREIDRITDRDSQLIEERVIATKELLSKLDKELALYESTISQLMNTKDTLKKIEDSKKAQSEKDYKEAGRRAFSQEAIFHNAPAAEPIAINAQPAEPAARDAVNAPRAEAETAPNAASIEAQAAEMAAAGLPNKIIAARLHKTITEIEMMLAMRN